MFSLHDIDHQVQFFTSVAEKLEAIANESEPIRSCIYRSTADGWRQAARSLERMIEAAIEREARDAMRHAS